jgi:serine/threonine protein phosphatase 1
LILDRLFGRKTKHQAPPSTGGRLVYAVGDVHGRLDVLRPLMAAIAEDFAAARTTDPALLVFLGDYVDRGPDSKGVVDLVLGLRTLVEFEVRTLKGNHEEAILDFLADPSFGGAWMEHGGGPTLASYGVQPANQRTDTEAWGRAAEQLRQLMPPSHKAFYDSLELMVTEGDYAFVHAGVRPGVALEEQTERDLLWIRQEFIAEAGPHPKVIVHGHTPSEEAQMMPWRLGIDTGCYATGLLTAVRLLDTDQRLIQARAARRLDETA